MFSKSRLEQPATILRLSLLSGLAVFSSLIVFINGTGGTAADRGYSKTVTSKDSVGFYESNAMTGLGWNLRYLPVFANSGAHISRDAPESSGAPIGFSLRLQLMLQNQDWVTMLDNDTLLLGQHLVHSERIDTIAPSPENAVNVEYIQWDSISYYMAVDSSQGDTEYYSLRVDNASLNVKYIIGDLNLDPQWRKTAH